MKIIEWCIKTGDNGQDYLRSWRQEWTNQSIEYLKATYDYDTAEAEDLVQEGWLSLVEDGFIGCPPQHYYFRRINDAIYEAYRKRRTQKRGANAPHVSIYATCDIEDEGDFAPDDNAAVVSPDDEIIVLSENEVVTPDEAREIAGIPKTFDRGIWLEILKALDAVAPNLASWLLKFECNKADMAKAYGVTRQALEYRFKQERTKLHRAFPDLEDPRAVSQYRLYRASHRELRVWDKEEADKKWLCRFLSSVPCETKSTLPGPIERQENQNYRKIKSHLKFHEEFHKAETAARIAGKQ